jgi:hypothetical protein
MKRIIFCSILSLTVCGLALARGQKKSGSYPELQNVRKIYVAKATGGSWLSGNSIGPAMRHIRGALEKSKCLTVVATPQEADAILVPFPYESWLDKLGEGLVGSCVSNNDAAICQGPNGSTSSVHCDSNGCMAGSTPEQSPRYMLIFLNPKTNIPLSNWNLRNFWGSKRKIEEAVGCKK